MMPLPPTPCSPTHQPLFFFLFFPFSSSPAGSVAGASFGATYLDLLGYLLQSGYHLVLGSPFSAYGETLIITVQSALLVLLLWRYQSPGAGHASVVTALLAAAAAVPFNLPPAYLLYVQLGTSVVFSVSRLLQIVSIARAGGIGNLSFVTLFMQFAGSAARIFTSSVEVKQVEVFYSFVLSTLLNGTLVAQWLYYTLLAGGNGKGDKTAPAAAAPAPAAAPAAKPAAAKPAAAAKPQAEEEAEAKAPPSSSSKKGKAASKKTQ